MVLTEKAFFDFLYCSLYFYCKYGLKVPLNHINALNNCIMGTIKFFYSGLLNGQVKTYKQIQSKWDALASEAGLDNKQLIVGWGKVVKIIEWSKANQIIVGDVNCKYTYSSTNHTIEAQIDFVLIHKNHDIEILYFDLSDRRLNELDEHKKLKYALDYFGFEKLYGKSPTRIKIYQPKHDEEIIIQLLQDDQRRLTSVIQNVGESIKQKLYVPRETFLCNSCLAKSYCRHFYNTK